MGRWASEAHGRAETPPGPPPTHLVLNRKDLCAFRPLSACHGGSRLCLCNCLGDFHSRPYGTREPVAFPDSGSESANNPDFLSFAATPPQVLFQ